MEPQGETELWHENQQCTAEFRTEDGTAELNDAGCVRGHGRTERQELNSGKVLIEGECLVAQRNTVELVKMKTQKKPH